MAGALPASRSERSASARALAGSAESHRSHGDPPPRRIGSPVLGSGAPPARNGARPLGRAAAGTGGMSTDRDAVRAAEVWRRHRPTGRDMSGRSFWIQVTFENATAAVGAVALTLQMILEP